MNNLAVKQYLRNQIDAKIANKRDALLESTEVLQNRMTRLVHAVKAESSFNSLGEIQGLGAEIDRLTGELALLLEFREKIGNMLDEAVIMANVFGSDKLSDDREEMPEFGDEGQHGK